MLLKLQNITKRFPGVLALDKVNLELDFGEVHALLGENGAGKSTLIKIIGGVYKADEGKIYYNGKEINFSSPSEAINNGIATIHQELNLFEDLTVAENIYVGNIQKSLINKKQLIKKAQEILSKNNFNIKAESLVKELNTSEKQLVAIAKSLSLKSKIIIMDEPTASITEHETHNLFRIVKELKNQGIGIIFISHRLEEVFEIADKVTVLRDGKYIGSGLVKDFSQEDLINMMVGRNIKEMFPKYNETKDEVVFSIKNLNIGKLVKNVSFEVKKGEIFGIAGLVGSGKSEIPLGIYGYMPAKWDELIINNREIKKIKDPNKALDYGIALVPEDRKSMGLVLDLDIVRNIILQNIKLVEKYGILFWKNANKIAEEEIKKYSIKATSYKQKTGNLSGGNQQKVVISKVLKRDPKVVFLVEPTRGIDVGAKVEVYNIVNRLANNGNGVIFVSSELPEIVSLCDRVLVMHRGKNMGILEGDEITQENILKLATGVDI
ncbi:monosaccharide ABC transporter ATP-binding protein, CUT2 family [Marinitoga hydrogenitolerans DSM 16785]|uniref:Monosaccharide ABC transporter ATP-binding protein, CUT2 family n=1 Tax=Marinitoga hydrogenitolerans (strain DSM 16785 / JCM 12826 / AT1271) TaxID=1122195 RepID=A0A1M4VIC0_MARH1|nr:sugar ABC transporter ATP-binding protein [Marinitoga hydrogenitolerans]SHE68597.1 monosaccharide ABC transporter ATP-binding protein, CUT2 family [Marinitoga hydrogenitolerans DSM 16785]